MEGASGVSFGDYVEKNIAQVVGMKQTRLDVHEDIVPFRARNYSTAQDSVWTNSLFVDLSDRYPAGGFQATSSDLVAFGTALLECKLLTKETWTAMTKRQKTVLREEISYGLGWRLSDQPVAACGDAPPLNQHVRHIYKRMK